MSLKDKLDNDTKDETEEVVEDDDSILVLLLLEVKCLDL